MTHPNEDLVHRGYAAFGTGDIPTLGELFSDDVIWHVGGRSTITGDYKGKAEVFGLFGRLAQETAGTFRLEVHDVLANDEHAIGMIRTTGERAGRTLDDNGVQVFHIEDGKVTESWFYPGDQYASDGFWS
jgi:ketosteroid isomerase-like protein